MPEECSADILEMVDSCLQEDPDLRPSAKEVGQQKCALSAHLNCRMRCRVPGGPICSRWRLQEPHQAAW